ncbi:The GLUG motif protein [compost metagenome]
MITDCIAKGKITATAYIGGLVGFIKENVDVANNTTVVTIISSEGYVGGLAGQVSSPITNCISSGTLNTSGDNIGGLVGYANATITGSSSSANVTHTGNIFTGNFMGGLTGVAKFTITNCHASGTVTGSNGIGGLVGDSYAPTIDSHASGNVNGNAYVGGLAGNSDAVINSYASGNVAAYQDMAGGLAGQSYGAIERSYAKGAVSGAKSVGGLVGISYMAVSHSFASGNITGTNPDITPEGGLIDIGGLIGNTFNMTTNCYATGNISAQSNSMYIGGLIGFSGGEVAHCYASGTIEGEAYGMVGGLIGDAWANVTNSVAANPSITTSASGNPNTVKRLVGLTEFDAEIAGSYALQSMRINGIGGFAGTPEDNQGLNKTTMQLQTGLNYESNMAWDFTTVWTIREGQGYPFFEYVSHLTSIISSSVNNETQGIISPIGDISVEDGSSRSYTITPAEGYEIESVLVDNVNIGTGAAYNFSNIIANHSIVANFRLIVLDIDDRNLVGLKAYPNPVNDVLNISYSQDISNIEIYGLLGQLIIAETVNDKQVQVDMSNLRSGAYFVKVTSDSKTKTVKIIK